jgi:hypothetical protein
VGGTAGGGGAAIQHAVPVAGGLSCRRVVALGFPLETLRPAERVAVMARALNYLDCFIDTVIVSPEEGRYYRTTPAFTMSASGAGVTGVELQLRRNDGLYWSLAGWSGTAAWVPAHKTGDSIWSYWTPLQEGTYVLLARAVSATAVDNTPARVAFGLDTTAPRAVSVISPTGGVMLYSPLVRFTWTALPPDGGSPLHYEVELNGRLHTQVPGTPYVAGARKGTHIWRVRAMDAAGNPGPWSPTSTFEVEALETFMPLLMRRH